MLILSFTEKVYSVQNNEGRLLAHSIESLKYARADWIVLIGNMEEYFNEHLRQTSGVYQNLMVDALRVCCRRKRFSLLLRFTLPSYALIYELYALILMLASQRACKYIFYQPLPCFTALPLNCVTLVASSISAAAQT